MTRTGDWHLYFDAIGKGALDVIRCPRCATDIELIIIRAIRENQQVAFSPEIV